MKNWHNSPKTTTMKKCKYGGTELDKTEHRGDIFTTHHDLKIGVTLILEIWGVKTTLGTLCS